MAFCSWAGGEHYKDHFGDGVYVCSKCSTPLFKSIDKYKHNSPWPAFSHPATEGCLKKYEDGGPRSLKVLCKKCGNPLGHEFVGDGEKDSGGQRGSRF